MMEFDRRFTLKTLRVCPDYNLNRSLMAYCQHCIGCIVIRIIMMLERNESIFVSAKYSFILLFSVLI